MTPGFPDCTELPSAISARCISSLAETDGIERCQMKNKITDATTTTAALARKGFMFVNPAKRKWGRSRDHREDGASAAALSNRARNISRHCEASGGFGVMICLCNSTNPIAARSSCSYRERHFQHFDRWNCAL